MGGNGRPVTGSLPPQAIVALVTTRRERSTKMIRKHFRLKRIALGLAFAAVVVPVAQAKPVSQSPVRLSGAALVNAPAPISVQSRIQLSGAALVNAPAPVSVGSPIHLTGPALVNAPAPVSHITAAGAALANAKHAALPVPSQVVETSTSGNFNWSDAGIGASVSIGALLLLLTAVGFGRRARSRGLASA
jgi:hypothetical protein